MADCAVRAHPLKLSLKKIKGRMRMAAMADELADGVSDERRLSGWSCRSTDRRVGGSTDRNWPQSAR